MWLTDLLPAQPEFPVESTLQPAADDPATNAPARQSGPAVCRQRLTSPNQAGAADWKTLAAWKDEFPHLRPCPQAKNDSGDWLWVSRSRCQGCQGCQRAVTGAPGNRRETGGGEP